MIVHFNVRGKNDIDASVSQEVYGISFDLEDGFRLYDENDEILHLPADKVRFVSLEPSPKKES